MPQVRVRLGLKPGVHLVLPCDKADVKLKLVRPSYMGQFVSEAIERCRSHLKCGWHHRRTVTISPDFRKSVHDALSRAAQRVRHDESQADPAPFSATRQDDMTIVSIGSERYEIPDAVILSLLRQ